MFLLRRTETRSTAMSHAAHSAPDEQPLFSMGFLLRTMAVIAILAVLTVAISVGEPFYVPRRASETEVEQYRQRLDTALAAAEESARRMLTRR